MVFKCVDFGNQFQPHVQMLEGGPRPTRKTDFHWKQTHRTICITLEEGSKRAAHWVELHVRQNANPSQGPGP